MLAVAHEVMTPPSSHVFTVDKAPWEQDSCGVDSLQIAEEDFGYKLNVSITCGSVNVTKLFSMIAEVSGATDYVANTAYYNITDGKLIQTPDGDWIFSKLDSSDKIEVKFSGTPDMYDFILPTQGGNRTVKLTRDQVSSVFSASLVSEGAAVDLGSMPTLEPVLTATEVVVEPTNTPIPEATLPSIVLSAAEEVWTPEVDTINVSNEQPSGSQTLKEQIDGMRDAAALILMLICCGLLPFGGLWKLITRKRNGGWDGGGGDGRDEIEPRDPPSHGNTANSDEYAGYGRGEGGSGKSDSRVIDASKEPWYIPEEIPDGSRLPAETPISTPAHIPNTSEPPPISAPEWPTQDPIPVEPGSPFFVPTPHKD